MTVTPDQFCIKVTRFGALGVEEPAGNVQIHQTDRTQVEYVLDLVMRSLCPGDRTEITIWRGHAEAS